MERKRGRPSFSESEKKRRRKSSRAKYKLCDVNIGHNIQRWNELREMKRLKTNQEVAAYLLDLAEKEIKIGGSREEKSMMPSTSGPSTSTPFRHDITGVPGVAEIRSSSGEDKGVGEKAMWTGVMHHIVNEHEWVIGHGDYSKNHCIHGPLEETDRNKQWLHPVKNSATLKDLARIVFDKRLLNQIDKYLNFRSTADLESFHQHGILMYCAKRFAYSPPIYRVRNLLAALDHNLHLNRPNHLNKDGSLRLNRTWNKKSGRWTVRPIKQEKEFSYIPELLIGGLKARLEDQVGMKKGKALEASDPRRISAHLAPVPPESS